MFDALPAGVLGSAGAASAQLGFPENYQPPLLGGSWLLTYSTNLLPARVCMGGNAACIVHSHLLGVQCRPPRLSLLPRHLLRVHRARPFAHLNVRL